MLLLAGLAYVVLERAIIAHEGPRSELARAVGRTLKEKLSPVAYAVGIALAFVHPWLADLVYAGVALAWIVPDRRIESRAPRPLKPLARRLHRPRARSSRAIFVDPGALAREQNRPGAPHAAGLPGEDATS